MEICSSLRSDADWSRAHELAIYGAGIVGVSAAIAASKANYRVTLIDSRCDLLWEITRAFASVRPSRDPVWRSFMRDMERHCPRSDKLAYPAWAEIAAARLLSKLGVQVLFFARPIGWHRGHDGISHVAFATKNGVKNLSGCRWIDASEAGTLARIAALNPAERLPNVYHSTVVASAESWPENERLEIGTIETERVLRVESFKSYDPQAILAGLRDLGRGGPAAPLVTLASYQSLPEYRADEPMTPLASDNFIICSPGSLSGSLSTLDERFALGARASDLLHELRPVQPGIATDREIEFAVPTTACADTVVVGAGTGGAIAAIAAARAGAQVLCTDLNQFLGGTTTGSGIHSYCYGVSGGLQEEVDDLVQSIQPLFGSAKQMRGYHPEARRLALTTLFEQYGVQFLPDTMLFTARREGGHVRSASVAGAKGIVELAGEHWVDATGDGDLCALAGVPFKFGRESDGITSPYTQSGVQVKRASRGWYLGELNYDSGWVDPTDPGDMTRARLTGLEQLSEVSTEFEDGYLLAASPMVGLRQSRQIETQYTLGLDDLIVRRSFPDAIAHVGAFFDNHLVDYQLESSDAIFLVWCIHQLRAPAASELPVRSLLPLGLDNVVIACRALGVSRDAHHAIRMMRDMQRLGEAAGTLAAMRLEMGQTAALEQTRARLFESGSLFGPNSSPRRQTRFGSDAVEHFIKFESISQEKGLLDLANGKQSQDLWVIYRDYTGHSDSVLESLRSNNVDAAWLAACIAGLRGERAAETRLIDAFVTREIGPVTKSPKDATDSSFCPFPPRWVVAIAVLERCGTIRASGALLELLNEREAGLDVHVAAVRALTAIAKRGADLDRGRISELAASAFGDDLPGVMARPQQFLVTGSEAGLAHRSKLDHDARWKLLLSYARLLDAVGLASEPILAYLREDERALVRHAYGQENAAI